jgi:hypothetical protein
MTKKFNLHQPTELAAVPGAIYAAIISNLVAAGASEDQAETLADAVLGPLKLVPPRPETNVRDDDEDEEPCGSSYFSYEGKWMDCCLTAHGNDIQHARSKGRLSSETWDDDDPRAIPESYV